MYRRIIKLPLANFFLLGPRGTGKSTLLKQKFKNAYFIDLLEPEQFRKFSARTEYLKEVVEANLNKKTFVIDEIQKIPQLLEVVHILIEKYKDINFILTGSSSRKLKRGASNLLAGRAILKVLHPFLAYEMGNDFSIKKALKYGTLPIVVDSPTIDATLRAYIGLYLQEEVQSEGLVKNIGNFSRFLEKISFSHSNILSISNIARECEVERKLVQNYLEILEDLLIGFCLPVFNKRAKRKTIKHKKFYFFDCGVFSSLRPKGYLNSIDEIYGGALEGLVAQHLRAFIDYREKYEKLYYYRTTRGTEVDFIIYGEDCFYAIEVKNNTRINSKDLRSLKTFKSEYKQAKLILLYMGQEKLIKDGILCLPVETFLKNLDPDKDLL